jgi:hypothetical protein
MLVPELNIKVSYPDDGMRGEYRIERSTANGLIAGFDISARYGNFILQGIYFTNFDSVDAFARRFLASGEEWDVDADALETGDVYLAKKKAFDERAPGDFYDDFAEYNGRVFANKRSYTYPGGYFYDFSFTYINDTRIQVIITSLDDSLMARIHRQLQNELGDEFNHADVWVIAVSDSLKEGYHGILSGIHIDRIK